MPDIRPMPPAGPPWVPLRRPEAPPLDFAETWARAVLASRVASIVADKHGAHRTLSEIQRLSQEIEGLKAQVAKLEYRRQLLEGELLETADRAMTIERARELALRVTTKAPPKVTYRCRYCTRHTRSLYGSLPVCAECRYQIEFDNALENLPEEVTDADNG